MNLMVPFSKELYLLMALNKALVSLLIRMAIYLKGFGSMESSMAKQKSNTVLVTSITVNLATASKQELAR